jgi:hypothetical protein
MHCGGAGIRLDGVAHRQGHSQVVEAVKRLATLALLLLTWCGVRCEIKR